MPMFFRICLAVCAFLLLTGTAAAAVPPRAYMISPDKIQIDTGQPISQFHATDLRRYAIRKTDVGHVHIVHAATFDDHTIVLDVQPAQHVCAADRFILTFDGLYFFFGEYPVRTLEFGTFCP